MNKLEALVKCITKDHVYIQTHNFPDPDAISSALGMQMLLKHKGVSSTICYKGKIDRYSTKRMIESLGIEIIDLESLGGIAEDAEVILVDAQKGNANIVDMVGNEIACVDHHPIFNDAEYRFCDIRPSVGACASIIAEYFFENDIEVSKTLATALVYGLRVDTANLSRGIAQLDLDVFYRLYDLCDKGIVDSLDHNTIHCNELQAYANAINSIKVYDDISFANTGNECPETLIATVSDFMLSLVEVKFSIVYSVRNDGIKFSVRNKKPKLDAGKIAYTALEGIGSGGGHSTMAGGFVPISEDVAVNDARIKILVSSIEERFLDAISNYN